MHPPDERVDPTEAKAVLDQFVALGYVDKPDEDKEKAMEKSVRELNYNLARAYMDARQPHQALPLLEQLAKENPEERRFRQQLAECHLNLGHTGEARKILESFLEGEQPGPWSEYLMGIIEYEDGNTDEALAHLMRAEQANPRRPKLHLRPGNAESRSPRWAPPRRALTHAIEM